MHIYQIRAVWDSEAQVWVATSDDVPGLVAEADSCDELVKKLKVLIPELLEANGLLSSNSLSEIPFHLSSELTETAIAC